METTQAPKEPITPQPENINPMIVIPGAPQENTPVSLMGNRKILYILAGVFVVVLIVIVVYAIKSNRVVQDKQISPATNKVPTLEESLTQQGQQLYESLKTTKASLAGPVAVAGPILIELSERFGAGSLNVYAPNIDFLTVDDAVDIKLSSVLGSNGQEILDKESSFEQKIFFSSPTLKISHDPIVHLEGRRDINILSSARDIPVNKVMGTVIVRVPQQIKTLVYTAEEMLTGTNATGTEPVVTMDENDKEIMVRVVTSGDKQNLGAITAYDNKGQEVDFYSRNILDDGFEIYYKKPITISKVTVSIAQKVETKTFNFSIIASPVPAQANPDKPSDSPKLNSSTTTPVTVDEQTKKDIVTGMAKTWNALASAEKAKDVQKIKDIFLGMPSTEEEKKQITNASDKEVLDMAGLMVKIYPEPTMAWLTDPKVKWSVTGDEASININDGGLVIKSVKVNGQWR